MHETIYIQRKFTETVNGTITTVKAEIHQLGNQSPYFSLTYGTEDYLGYTGGAIFGDNDVLKHFPAQVATAHRWHLYSPQTCFMHYIPNALYWYDMMHGKYTLRAYDPNPLQAIRNTIGYGILQRDIHYSPENMTRANLVSWLNARRGGLRAAFVRDMAILFDVPFTREGLPLFISTGA